MSQPMPQVGFFPGQNYDPSFTFGEGQGMNWPQFIHPANPPAELSAWQGAGAGLQQQPALQYMPVQGTGNVFRDYIPANGGIFFGPTAKSPSTTIPAPQAGSPAGPGYLLTPVDAATRAAIEEQKRQEKEAKKTGPRRPKRKRQELEEEVTAEQPPRKGGRTGPKKAGDGTPGYTACWRHHTRECTPATGCVDSCLFKRYYRAEWETKAATERNFRDPEDPKGPLVPTTELFAYMYVNAGSGTRAARRRRN